MARENMPRRKYLNEEMAKKKSAGRKTVTKHMVAHAVPVSRSRLKYVYHNYSSSTHNSQHSLKIMIRYLPTSLRRVDPDLDFKGVWAEVELIHIGVEI